MGISFDCLHDSFRSLFDPQQEFRCVGSGYAFTEGIVYDLKRQRLLFSDIPNAVIYQAEQDSPPVPFITVSHKANGNCFDCSGNLITCEHAASRLVRRDADGGHYQVLAQRYRGCELNSPNDVVVRSDGLIYFTDPRYGRNPKYYEEGREQQLPFQGVYCCRSDGSLLLLDDSFMAPNGLCFSPDESLLYINDSMRFHIRVFDVLPDGSLTNGRLFAPTFLFGNSAPDGMKVDRLGNVYLAAMGGILVYAPDGTPLGRIITPTETENFCFGGPDLKTVYTASKGSVYSFRMRVPGNPSPYDKLYYKE